MTIDSTVAKIGRSMKKWDNVMQPGSSPAGLWPGDGRFWRWQGVVPGDCLPLGIDLGAWPHPLHAVDDHPILRLESVANHAQTVAHRSQLHLAVFHGVLVIDHEGEALRLIGAEGLVREQQRLVLATPRDTDARKEAGGQHELRVGEYGPSHHRAGVRIEPIINEIDIALVRKSRFIRQRQIGGIAYVAGAGTLSSARQTDVLEI